MVVPSGPNNTEGSTCGGTYSSRRKDLGLGGLVLELEFPLPPGRNPSFLELLLELECEGSPSNSKACTVPNVTFHTPLPDSVDNCCTRESSRCNKTVAVVEDVDVVVGVVPVPVVVEVWLTILSVSISVLVVVPLGD